MMNLKILSRYAVFLVACSVPVRAETVFHVGPGGDDAGPGTQSRPFATLERAREAVRSAGSAGPRSVVVHRGDYQMRSTLALSREDSGTESYPVTWSCARDEKVRLIGGKNVPARAFRSLKDAALLARLGPAARNHVLMADLHALGMPTTPEFPVAYHGAPPGPELFFNGRRMALARWPNEGWATVAAIVESGSYPRKGDQSNRPGVFEYSGDRPERWKAADGTWLQGYWCFDWYDETIRVDRIDTASRRITFAAPHFYSLRQGNPSPRRYRAINVLAELDSPGEFYVERSAGLLFFWPPSDISDAQITVSTLDAPVVTLRDCSHVIVRGFTIESGLGEGVEITGGTGCRVEACEIRNMRRIGIRVAGGTNHRVESCDIHDTGTGGIVLEGGDRKTLAPAGHEASNNHIWRFSIHQLTYAYALSIGGVGNRAAHNLMHDAPHEAIIITGNDNILEYNEIHRVCTETDDSGAFHKGRNPSSRGNQIRFNYWHDLGSPMGHGTAAVYFDDGDGGEVLFGNVFYRCGDPGRGPFGTVFSHGGHDTRAENNIFIDCKRALGSAPWDDARWRNALKDRLFVDELLKDVDITKPPYITRYPELVDFMNPQPGHKRVNRARWNLLVRCGQATSGNWEFDPAENLVLDQDPGFVDAANGDFSLRGDSEVFRRLSGFKPIPFDRIGLRRTPAASGPENRDGVRSGLGPGPRGFRG
jgi:hypothetical protein